MSCNHCPPSGDKGLNPDPNPKDNSSNNKNNGLFTRLQSLIPEGAALLSSSCCWLPTALNFVFAGSVTAASVHRLRPFFLVISIVTLAWSVMRDGLNRRNIVRAIVCAGLLAWSQYSQQAQPATATGHSCH